MTIDLSFTKDPAWIEARTRVWEPWAKELKTDLRKKELEQLRHYFFTGERLPNFELSDSAKMLYFPLMNAEGWNYVFQHLAQNPSALYSVEYYQSINGKFDRLGDLEASLRYFDYFHGDMSQTAEGGVAPYRPAGFEIDLKRKESALFAAASRFIKLGTSELIYHRRYLLFRLLSNIKSDSFRDGEDIYILLSGIMRQILEHNPKVDLGDANLQKALLLEFRTEIENLEEQSLIRLRWQEIQQESMSG